MTAVGDPSENITLVNRELLPAQSYTESDDQSRRQKQQRRRLRQRRSKLHGKSSADGTHDDDDGGDDDEADEIQPEVDVLGDEFSLQSQYHQEAITLAKYGLCQWALLPVVGLALAADLVEILSVAFLIPSAGQELCLSKSDRTWIGGTVLCGMFIGSALWGILGDKIGRRKALTAAMFTNALFGVISAFMPNYSLLLITRLISGAGAGGILPMAIVYYGEFLGRQHRGVRLTWVGLLWSLGGVFVALMAWAIIPRTGFVLMGEKKQYFCSWRVFSILCSLPALISALTLAFVPESPRFLLEIGREVEAILVYKWIHKLNHFNHPESLSSASEQMLSELALPSKQQLLGILPQPVTRSLILGTIKGIDTFWRLAAQVCHPPYTHTTIVLSIVWMTTAFSYYGLSVWLPELLESVEASVYYRQARNYRDEHVSDAIFNTSLENSHFFRCHFRNVVFTDLVLNHVRFVNTSFVGCIFNGTRSSRTRFYRCDFQRTVFLDTDLYEDKFDECSTYNCTFLNTAVGCPVDFDVNFRLATLFAQVLCTHVAVLPGTAVAALCIDKLGRVRLLGISLFVASVFSLSIPLLNSQPMIIAFEAITNFLFMIIWSTIQVITTEAYSANMRTTAFGSLVAVGRVMGILGCIAFGRIQGQSKTLPVLMTVSSLLIGGIVSIKLPDTRSVLL